MYRRWTPLKRVSENKWSESKQSTEALEKAKKKKKNYI